MAADHLSRLENPELEKLKEEEIDDNFPNEYLMVIAGEVPWFADIMNFLASDTLNKNLASVLPDNLNERYY